MGTDDRGWTRITSPEEVVRLCPTSFYAHDLEQLSPDDRFSVGYRVHRIGPVMFGDVVYGADVRLDFHELAGGYLVNVPVRGVLDVRHRGRRQATGPGTAGVYHPEGTTVISRWPAGARTLAVRLGTAAVDRTLRRMGVRPAVRPQPPECTAIDVTGGAGRSWVELLRTADRDLRDPGSVLHNPLVAEPFAESVVTGFLLAACPAYAQAAAVLDRPAAPAVVRRAVDLLEADPAFPWTIGTLAERCGTGVRTLQIGFRRHLDTTPTAYLRSVRLRRVHADLWAATRDRTTVAAVAHRWGFSHLGRFAAAYRREFGEPPGRTLRAG